jgi:tetratricopeptide (TPR) repeat protein
MQPAERFSLSPSVQEDLLALARMLRRGKGHFVLGFARCNIPTLRRQLVAMLKDALTPAGVTIHEVELNAEATDLPATLAAAAGDGDPLFVYGLSEAMPSPAPRRILAQLNERRGQYQKLNRPLVFWLPEYAVQLVARDAPDFWAWRSGVYAFYLPPNQKTALFEQEVRDMDWTVQWNLDRAAKEARLHLLRGLLDEYAGEQEEAQRARAETLRKLADLEETLVGYEAARPRLQETLSIYERLGDRRGVAVTQGQLAYLLQLRGDYEEAERLYRESLQTTEQLGDRRGVAVTQGQLADLLQLRGDYEEAERLYRESLQTTEQLGDRREVAVTLHNMALLRQAQERLPEALELLSHSRDLFAALGLQEDVVREEELITQLQNTLGNT